MVPGMTDHSGHVVSLIDVGTNSARLMVVRLNPNRSYTILNQYKVMVRLGDGEFSTGKLQSDAIDRTILVLKRFVEMASNLGADDFWAVSTSATRDAENRQSFIDRVKREVKLDLRIITGLEEARLIYLGVSSGVHLMDKHALFIDIGGGSTEIITGNQMEFFNLDSIRLGAIRLKNMFFLEDDEGIVTDEHYALIRQYVKNHSLRSIQRIRETELDMSFGSSGTIETLYDIYQKNYASDKETEKEDEILELGHVKKVLSALRKMDLNEREKVNGMNPRRADIIIPGGAILQTIMEEADIGEIYISRRSLKNGLLHDYLIRGRYGYLKSEAYLSVREQSVLQLGRSCGFNETHSRHVADLSVQLFDTARKAKLHKLGNSERELLYYAAMLHDVGIFLSFSNHHSHTFYIINNAELLGFNTQETAIMAATAFYHSKKYPRKKDPQLKILDKDSVDIVKILSIFLSIAESLDRSHHQLIESVSMNREQEKPVLEVKAQEGHEIELWSIEKHQKYFKKIFGKNFNVQNIKATEEAPDKAL